ncbi:unnamed protein product [Chrysoparadoxa australica]
MGAQYSAGKCCRGKSLRDNMWVEESPKKRDHLPGHKQWTKLDTSGISPSPRSGHDVVVINNKVYLFGGCGGDQEQISCLNDLFSFDMDLHHWERVKIQGPEPSARASFGMCKGTCPGTLLVAGGTGVEMDSLRADVLEYDIRSRTWNKVLTDSEETPCKFYGQSVCTHGENLLLFGGSTGLHYTNDLFEYNVRGNKWKKLNTTGRKPSPRYKHQAVVVGDTMYVIGGGCFKPEQSAIDLYCLDLKTLEWEETVMIGDIPKARVAHSCSYDPEGHTIYLWGGFTGELSRLSDFFAFDIATGSWSEVTTADDNDEPPARAFHSAIFHEGALYLFSGANGDVRYNDVWKYQVRSSPPSLAVLCARALRESSVSDLVDMEKRIPEELVHGVLQMNEYADKLY